jgi:hypothetical protein
MIRTYEDREKNGATDAGTVVEPVNRELAVYAYSADEAEARIRKDVAGGKLPPGRVYQICPWMANPELIRSVAASLDGSFQRVFLDPAAGLYSELRRVRLPRPACDSE